MHSAKRIAVIGAGGKTTTLSKLAGLHRTERVLLTTTTHIFPFSPLVCDRLCIAPTAEEITQALAQPGVVCAGVPSKNSKLTGLSEEILQAASQSADWIFYEADGAKCLPLKLHSNTEPVILPGTAHCFVVAGLSAWGKPTCEVIHRYQLREDWAQNPGRLVDGAIIADCVRDAVKACGLPRAHLTVLLNQVDTATEKMDEIAAMARELEAEGVTCKTCSLQEDGDLAKILSLESIL
ncbi:selenium cofactor biosynthesis protein YqeC [Butyricicoccus pullicaecorum]|nr:selenium cofactor biosynthesis protein YqeC [Butyricicoccus pullicaecorum]